MQCALSRRRETAPAVGDRVQLGLEAGGVRLRGAARAARAGCRRACREPWWRARRGWPAPGPLQPDATSRVRWRPAHRRGAAAGRPPRRQGQAGPGRRRGAGRAGRARRRMSRERGRARPPVQPPRRRARPTPPSRGSGPPPSCASRAAGRGGGRGASRSRPKARRPHRAPGGPPAARARGGTPGRSGAGGWPAPIAGRAGCRVRRVRSCGARRPGISGGPGA